MILGTTHTIERMNWNLHGGGQVDYDCDLGGGSLRDEEHWRSDDTAAIVVRLGVDGSYDMVLAELNRSRDVSVLTRTIEVLTFVRDELQILNGDDGEPGKCMKWGETGRCTLTEHEGGDHDFPTEEECAASAEADAEAWALARKRRAS